MDKIQIEDTDVAKFLHALDDADDKLLSIIMTTLSKPEASGKDLNSNSKVTKAMYRGLCATSLAQLPVAIRFCIRDIIIRVATNQGGKLYERVCIEKTTNNA